MTWLVLAAVLALAYANGANDNAKGVATLHGSGTASYRRAIGWATVTTLAGSLLALVLAEALVARFSARGLVPDAVAAAPAFLASVGTGAAIAVLAATRLGLPVSTTHALTGGLLGAGWVAVGREVNLSVLGTGFVLPLLLSPLAAIAATATLYGAARLARRALRVSEVSCVCVGDEVRSVARGGGAAVATAVALPTLAVGVSESCGRRFPGGFVAITAKEVRDGCHWISAGAVGFARGLNDTPKIFALLFASRALGADLGLPAVALAMAIGGILGAHRVAETMSHRIAKFDAGEGLVANLTTAGMVILASRVGLPVSTTHVASGGLLGIGIVNGRAQWRTIATIAAAWVTTLPLAAALGALAYVGVSACST